MYGMVSHKRKSCVYFGNDYFLNSTVREPFAQAMQVHLCACGL